MIRVGVVLAVVSVALAGPVRAQASAQKAADCGHQAAVVEAIRQARLNKVRERQVQAHVLKNAVWPENYNTAIPLMTPWVYEMKMKDVRENDLAAAWTELCLQR